MISNTSNSEGLQYYLGKKKNHLEGKNLPGTLTRGRPGSTALGTTLLYSPFLPNFSINMQLMPFLFPTSNIHTHLYNIPICTITIKKKEKSLKTGHFFVTKLINNITDILVGLKRKYINHKMVGGAEQLFI